MKWFCLVCVLCGFGSAALAIDREAFTFTKCDLEIRLEPEQQRLGARGKVTLRNDSNQPQKIAVLQISSTLSWRSVKAGGKSVQYVTQPYVSDIDHTGALSEAVVTLPAEIKPTDSMELEIGYEGTIVQDAPRLTQIGVPEDIAKHASWDQISPAFTAVRGAGYVAWYPIATEPADFSEGNSLFQVTERWRRREAESAFKAKVVMSNTAGESPSLICTPGASGHSEAMDFARQVSAECSWARLGTATPTFVVANYKDLSKPPSMLFSLPGHETNAGTYLDSHELAFKFVSDWFGPPSAAIAIADLPD